MASYYNTSPAALPVCPLRGKARVVGDHAIAQTQPLVPAWERAVPHVSCSGGEHPQASNVSGCVFSEHSEAIAPIREPAPVAPTIALPRARSTGI